MSAPNGTLEDCQTNVFSLTELYGLNWCSLTTQQNYQYGNDVEQDPVLKAYGECLNEGLLCTWRRKPHFETPTVQPNANPLFKLDSPKELWVFWYTQEKPSKLESLIQSGLIYGEEAQDLSNGLNYETRVLFFKSLHNVIERCLLKNGYIRFGKWFAKPLEAPIADGNCSIPQYINGISFNFFLHGDNHVCMTVTVQRQPPLLKLSHAHFSSTKKQPILLGPWSLQAFLLPNQPLSFQNPEILKDSLGRESSIAASLNYASMMFDPSADKPGKGSLNNLSLKEIQAAVTKQWNDWKKFQALPVDGYEDIAEDFVPNENGRRVPKMVLVEIDGVKMFYPSCFVGVLVDEEVCAKPTVKKTEIPDPLCEGDHEVEQIFASAAKKGAKSNTKVPGCIRYWRKSFAGVRSARRLLEDACLSISHNNTGSALLQNSGLNAEDEPRHNFFDYLRRYYCYCRNCSTAAAASQEDAMFPFTAPTPIGEAPGPSSYAIHRSPPLLETVTPVHSPNFLETLGHGPDKDSETPIWSTQFKRRDTVGKRLQTKEQPKADIFEVLRAQNNTNFNENVVKRSLSPFAPITSISPEPDVNYKSIELQESLKAFEYKFNPLKRDHLKTEPYHKNTNSKKPLGPDRDRDSFFYLNDDENSRTPNPLESTTNLATGIENYSCSMNGFQENFPLSEFFATGPLAQETPMPNLIETIKEPTKQRKERRKKKSKWPSLDAYDVMHFSILEAEEAFPCVFIPEPEQPIRISLRDQEKVKIEEIWNGKENMETSQTEAQDVEQTMPYGDMHQFFISNDDAYENSTSIPNAMEATPPSFQHPLSSDSTILSPPASNESHATASINAASVGSIHSYITGPSSHPGPVNMHDSLSIIYPTPPTPMQQFSPQNHLVPSALLNDHASAWHPASVTSMEANEKLFDAELLIHGLVSSPIYSETKNIQAPNGDGFSDLFGETNTEPKLQQASKELRVSLKQRTERPKIRKPPDYMAIVPANRKEMCMPNQMDTLPNFNPTNGAFSQISSGPLEQLGSMMPPDVRLSQPSTSGMNMPPFGMPSQGGLIGAPNFGRPFGQLPGSGFPVRPGMPQSNQAMLPSLYSSEGGMFGSSSMQSQNQMGSFPRPQFMFPGQGFDPMNQMNPANMPPKPGFPPGSFQSQQSMMFRGMSSGASVLPLSNNPPMGASTSMSQNTGSPMPPPPYNSFGSPALNSMRSEHQMPQRTGSNPSLVHNALLPINNNYAPVSTADNASTFGGMNNSSSALFNTLQLKDVSTILQDGRSFIISLLLQDTLLNLHYDSIFDACPICSCNANIRGYELGIYIRTPDLLFVVDRLQQQPQLQNSPRFMADLWTGFTVTPGVLPVKCSCGFSAVRHRYLSGAGLFPSDIREATGLEPAYPGKKIPKNVWFEPNSKNDVKFLDLLRQLCQTRDLASLIMHSEYICEISRIPIDNKTMDFAGPTDYITSRVDSELNDVLGSVIDLACANSTSNNLIRPSKSSKKPILHQWGVQLASGILEPKEPECVGIIKEIQPFVEEAIRIVRVTRSNNNIVEGPLSWRDFHRKASKSATQPKQDDEGHLPEKIPNVIVANERDAVLASPQLLHAWEKFSLGPCDQPKDVLYMAVVPDSNVVVEKSKIFLEELSKVYEKCRFGRHVRILTKESIRDGIIRINHKSAGVLNDPELERIFRIKQNTDKKLLMGRLKSYVENLITELCQFFKTNDAIFERRMYYETLCRDSLQQNYTSLATSSDSNSMPPPAMPVQSPSSVLSSTSGPLSLGALQQSPAAPAQPSPLNYNPNMIANSNLASLISGTEPLTPESQIGTPGSQHDPTNLTNEATIDLEVQRLMSDEHPSVLPHVIVIYLVNPISFGGDSQETYLSRLAIVALMRAFNSFLHKLDITRRPQIQLELINLQTVYDYSSFVSDSLREDHQPLDPVEYSSVNDKMSAQDCLRRTAFSVYRQSRVLLAENVRNIIPKSMTRFGPASMMKDILDGIRDGQKNSQPSFYKIPSAPFILAPHRSIGTISTTGANNRVQLVNPDEKVLFVSYCLIDDDWLCAAVTDECGHLSDNVLINLTTIVEHKNTTLKHKNRSQIYDAISRLWLYIQGVLSLGTKNWRLVIGRLGRMGHGEFKVWTQLLSKKNLRAYNSSLKGRDKEAATPGPNSFGPMSGSTGCKSCSAIPGYHEIPAILSACLITTEPEPSLRVFPTLPPVGETTTSKSSKGKLPNLLDDPSITHIMVFPTSPDLQSAEQQGGAGIEEDNEFMSLFADGGQHMQDEEDLVGNLFDDQNLFSSYATETDNAIDNQPMATGFAVSLAPAHDLPEWFWSSCPSAKRRLPVHLKSSLHINASNIQQNDEILGNKTAGSEFHHPLDSTSTDEVLRYVLETYNALSWLNIDLTTGTRRSCLPVHIQSLLRLYRSVGTIFS